MSRLLLSPGDHSKTLVELLSRRASERPDQQVFTFLEDGENESSSLTFSELDRRARAVGALLQQRGLQGERALLLFPSGLDFIAAFFGCLYAGVVAVPAYPPRSHRALSKLKALINDAKPAIMLIDSSVARRFNRWAVREPDMPWINVDEVGQSSSGDWRDPGVSADTLAFLQYTSGSTATPKGVIVTHRNILHNEGLIKTAFQQDENSLVVGWLPLYHDMGLIGNVLQPIYAGSRCVLMPPMAFLQRPVRWLKCISRYGATTSGGPNFAYELCVNKISDDERRKLSLDTWKVAFNGAEPVRATTLNRFAEAFEPFGFRRSSFYPCYGLAEATLLVSSSGFLSGGKLLLVSSGQFVEPDNAIIVDPQAMRRVAPGETGEIWLQSPSVAQGYWNRPKETEEIFRAYLSDESGCGPFLRTGDLGLVENGQVLITGRLKDLIIVRGRNFYPQDIELTVEQSHPALRLGVAAAFSVGGDDGERLVLAQEIESQALENVESISFAARKAVADEHQVHLDEIVYVRAGTLPRTTSGKIQRHLCRERYLSKTLKTVAVSQAVSTLEDLGDLSRESLRAFRASEQLRVLESHIRGLVARLVKTRPELIDFEHSLLSSGLDSLMTVELQHRLEEQFDVNLPQFGNWSIASLAEEVVKQLAVGDQDVETRRRGDAESPYLRVTESPRRVESTHKIQYPLSYGQQALWFLHKLAPDAGAYNLAAAVSINGPLHVSALRDALQTLTGRHAVLRTNFREKDGRPVQWAHAEREVGFEEIDISAWHETAVGNRMADEAYRSFDLERDPLLRVHLFRKSAESFVLLLVIHHIIADFYSLEILLSDLTTLYRYNVTEKKVALEPLKRNYADYVQWQRQMLSTHEGEDSLEYWRARLSGERPVLNLPTKRVRPPVQTYRGAATELTVDSDITERLSSLARAQGVTLYTLLLTVFQVLLHRYTGQEDLIVGTPASGRISHEFADVMGYFVNPVPMRTSLTGNLNFSELLQQSGQTVREALQHQAYPFPLLVEQLECARDPSRSPIFQAMFVLQQTTRAEFRDLAGLAIGTSGARMQIGELTFRSVEIEQRASQFDLTLLAAEHDGGLSLRLQYNTDLFDGAIAGRLLDHYRNLLQSVVADVGQAIRELSLLTSEETHELVVNWNDTTRSFPTHQCMHELFEAQAERTPDAVALIFDDQSISYQELNRRANHVAHRLRALGLAREDRVAILMDRSAEMVVAILGVLKAGVAYVPIEPEYPRERIEFIFDDAGVAAVLTQEKYRQIAHENVLCIEGNAGANLHEPNLTGTASSDNLAYIIYTSGSTGRPKGVAITHQSAVTLLYWARDTFTDEDLKRVLASTSICFDLSIFELFVPLSWGGTIVLVKNLLELSTLKSPAELTLINTVPSVLAELLRDGRFPTSVLTVNLAGEALSSALVDETYRRMRAGRVLNLYGPSEDTTYSCYAIVAEGSETAPIGKPIANTQAYVLDNQLQLVPKGVIGELYLGGSGLARGYFNRPDLTAERFIPNPFDTGGARLYRTGDLVRHLEDGQLEFLGRADHQVKIRGFRVELGEIETVLRSHPGVQDAVAIAREDTPSDRRLVAYIVPKDGYEHRIADLRRHLQERLPIHIVPSAFVLLEALPLTPNGKLNRAALPTPEAPSSNTYTEPTTELERNLAGIWADLLNLERVSVNDDFFQLGGHSLLAARLTSRIWQQFDVELSLRTIFTTPTISGLAAVIESSGNGSSAVGISRVQRKPELLAHQGPDDSKTTVTDDGVSTGSDSDRVRSSSGHVLLRPAGDYTAPRTGIEETLADIWAELLSLDRVSVHDDFFEAGGHSLLAARLASRIRHTFAVEISLKSVFESPTIASQAHLIAASPRVEPETLLHVTDGPSFPLSYSQQRLWFLQSLDPDSPAYNLPGAIRLTGHLQSEVLKQSLNEIVRRHEVLRTRFVIVDGEPRQSIEPERQLDIQLIDLSTFPTEERDAELTRLMSEEARLPFDLTTCPLMRARLLRLRQDEHVLLLTLHHIVADGWSLGVMAREVGTLYSGLVQEQESPQRELSVQALPELPVQYVDFAVWQQNSLTTEKLQSHLEYWTTQLANSPSLLDLPTDRPRPQIQTFLGATYTFKIPEDLSRRLTDLSRSEGVTSFITLLTAFNVLLYQYTRQSDLLVGTPVANRTRLETESLIGCFVNTLVLRNDLSGNPDFRELLNRVRKGTLEAFEHQDLPFEKLVEELQPERRLSQSPLFQVMFVLQDAPAQALELPGLKLESLEVDSGTAKYDLTLSISQMPDSGLVARLEYNTDLFDETTAVRLLEQYQNILETVVDNPAQPILDLPLATAEERQRVLLEWNDTKVERSGSQFIHQLFETQAATHPDAIAVMFEGHALTYAELNRRANQLANHLRKLGVGPETFVGICVERSFEMVWGLLGILKAGAAYVPIDPAYPAERLSYMLEDSGVSLVLTQKHLAVASWPAVQVLVLDSFDHESTENPTGKLTPDNAAYAIYTSGSTGQPKAAVNTHGAIANRLLWMQDVYQLTTDDCVLQKTPFSFDVSVWEFFWPLLAGARLVLARPGGQFDSRYLIDLIVDDKVTTVHFVPSMLQMFLEDPAVGQCKSLRRIICSGEALSPNLMQRCFAKLGVELHNLYGPTEAAVDVTSWKCDPASSNVPIGRPIANTQIYILNPELQLVPVGVHGELHIGGVSLARGYLNRPGLTAERFIPDPFSTTPGARLYKTGDSCRYLADGNIEFVERLDHQVKMRGFRIELGEIESALRQHSMVREAVVTVHEEQSDQKRLVAYVVTDDQTTFVSASRRRAARVSVVTDDAPAGSVTDFREFLKKQLPDYMVPSAFMVLEKMPLTSSGKIDRKALPRPDGEILATRESYTPPRTDTEQTLADIWARVLGLERVGVTDNFFEVGGDSIVSMRVVIEARKCGIELKPRDIFAHQTIAELAALADNNTAALADSDQARNRSGGDQSGEVLIGSGSDPIQALQIQTHDKAKVDDVYPLTPVQEGMLFHSAYSPESELYFEQLSLTLTGDLDTTVFRRTWQELVNRHPILRTAFVWENVSDPVQVVHSEASLPWSEFDWRCLSETEQQSELNKLLHDERARGFDCSVPPLMRVSLARLTDNKYTFVWSHHHLLLDGWSQPLLLKEFLSIYTALSSNCEVLVTSTPPFRNYLSWLQHRDMAAAEAYWRAALKGFASPAALATIPKSSADTHEQTREHTQNPQRLVVNRGTTSSLKSFVRQHHLTLSTLMQGAWALLLSYYTGEDDVAFGVTVSGRPTDLEGADSMVGMFINTLPMRVKLEWHGQLLPWLRQIQTNQSELMEYAYSPLARVQHWSDVPPGTALFESIVVFQNYPIEQSLEGIKGQFEISSVRAYETTKYPLMLVVEPGEELSLRLLYDSSRFDSFLVARMLLHLQRLLQSMACDSRQDLGGVQLLTDTERKQILKAATGARASFAKECIHEIFEAQARRTPDAHALTFGQTTLTYRELDAQVNQLAHHLRNVGVSSQSPVGVCLERSAEMVAVILAIFKAGGVFVPLNPQYPHEQLAYIMKDAAIEVLITDSTTQGIGKVAPAKVVDLDEARELIAQCETGAAGIEVKSDDLAYVIYTSGSTGKPKGVVVEHRNLINTLQSSLSTFAFRPDDVIACVSAFSFDIFLFELLCPLLSGGRCLLIANETLTDAASVRDMLRDVTVIHAVPTLMRQLLAFVREDGTAETANRVRQVFVGGDAVPPELVKEIQQVFPHATVDVLYGPTEATIICAHHTAGKGRELAHQMIGKPMHNVTMRLCDKRGNLVPAGVKGEIYIGGAGVSRGYLNNETLTREKYVWINGQRYYRSGDHAWQLPDGSFAFAGRSDLQTKVRGFRIEPGEIESNLLTHPDLSAAVVVAQDNANVERRLIAYVVARNNVVPSTSELRSHLQERLPEHMLPSAFVVLEKLPLTPHGKIDRRALPVPEPGRPELSQVYVAPRTPVEKALTEIWAPVLQIDRVGIHDSFFELGGDSIVSIRLLARARQKGLYFTARQLFENATIAQLAPLVEEREVENLASAASASQRPIDGSKYTPSDFVDADVKQRELDRLLTKINSEKK